MDKTRYRDSAPDFTTDPELIFDQARDVEMRSIGRSQCGWKAEGEVCWFLVFQRHATIVAPER